MTSPTRYGRLPVEKRPAFNTHVHLPPNFSAFETVEDAIETAAREDVRIVGSSNFHDFGVYDRFEAAAREHGIAPLFGLEFISVLAEEQRHGVKINDPDNPGRAYICGKGIPAPTSPSPATKRFMDGARASNEARTRQMVELIGGLFSGAGVDLGVDYGSIVAAVAARAQVPAEWVVLQERHVALGFQSALFEQVPEEQRSALLGKVYGQPARAAVDDAVATQGELRSRLMKAGCPAFVEETPIPFTDGLAFVLGVDAIPVYPTVADGIIPICGFEDPVEALIERMLGYEIYGAELIPLRNSPETVDAYVRAWRDAGIFTMVGTEHNTLDRIPVEPRCRGGIPLSPMVKDICWEGTCIVAAHQQLRREGKAGYVDGEGRLNPTFPDGETRMRYFAELGEEILIEATGTAR